MTLHRILKGSIKKSDGSWAVTGDDVEISDADVARINKGSAKRLEPTSVAIAREKAEVEKKKAIDEAEKKAKIEAEKKAKESSK